MHETNCIIASSVEVDDGLYSFQYDGRDQSSTFSHIGLLSLLLSKHHILTYRIYSVGY